MTREQLLQFLKENIRLTTEETRGYYGEHSLEIKLEIDGEEISSVYVDLAANSCKCKCVNDGW